MKRIARIQQRKRQTWLGLPASGIDEVGHGRRTAAPDGRAAADSGSHQQHRNREKAAAKDATLAVEKFTVEVAGVFKPYLKKVMKDHEFNNKQEIHRKLLRNLNSADFKIQAWMLRCVTTPYEIPEKVSRVFYEKSMAKITSNPGDEVVIPR